MRKILLACVLMLLLGACGGAENATLSADGAATTTVVGAQTTTTAVPETTAATTKAPDGPAAPDFELELSDGSTFVLSEAQKPIYMVFWAEW